MSAIHPLRALFPVAVAALAAVLAASCGGTFEGRGSSEGVHSGGTCSPNGSQTKAADGCNTCTCGSGAWSCTELACAAEDGGMPVPGTCTPGASRSADDGCNTCQCTADGTWACTGSACTGCKPGETTNDGCNTCSCSGGQWACTDRACPPPPICNEGETQTAPDGCNTCSCSGGQWACTKKLCPPAQCKDGETMYDGCNNCSCMNGQWGCTLRYCPPAQCQPGETKSDGCTTCSCAGGQWACTVCPDAGGPPASCGGLHGDQCGSTEYCAYTEGQQCGANDGASICKPRPAACTTNYNPVCGCDGKNYSNTCFAAGAGTGVLHAGPC